MKKDLTKGKEGCIVLGYRVYIYISFFLLLLFFLYRAEGPNKEFLK